MKIMSKIFVLLVVLASFVYSQENIPAKKQTTLELYITAEQAYQRWKINPERIKVLDVRTPEEYAYVGHAPMAVNVPLFFMSYKYDAKKKWASLIRNEDFFDEIKTKLSTDDTIFVMRRSGGRGAKACNIFAKNDYKHVYNIIDGFEGDKVKDVESYNYGKRILNGWKNSHAPWTYELDPNLMYIKEK